MVIELSERQVPGCDPAGENTGRISHLLENQAMRELKFVFLFFSLHKLFFWHFPYYSGTHSSSSPSPS